MCICGFLGKLGNSVISLRKMPMLSRIYGLVTDQDALLHGLSIKEGAYIIVYVYQVLLYSLTCIFH